MLPTSMRMLSLVLVVTCSSLACVGLPPPPPVSDASTSTTTSSSTDTTPSSTDTNVGATTTPDPATFGMPGESTEGDATTASTTAGVGPTTDGESSGAPPECMGPADCGANETCTDNRCVDACGGAWGMGSYGHCLTEYGSFDTSAICGPDHLCVSWGDPIEQTACARQGCVDVCDCPPPPASGNATVTCGQVTNPPGVNDCYLSCANGETCPDGMTCNADGVCVTDAELLPVYGDCGNLAPGCAAPGFCVGVKSGEGVCTMPCNNALDCPAVFPPGGNAVPACNDVNPDSAGFECYLSCIGALTCPDGMTCINGTLCMWED